MEKGQGEEAPDWVAGPRARKICRPSRDLPCSMEKPTDKPVGYCLSPAGWAELRLAVGFQKRERSLGIHNLISLPLFHKSLPAKNGLVVKTRAPFPVALSVWTDYPNWGMVNIPSYDTNAMLNRQKSDLAKGVPTTATSIRQENGLTKQKREKVYIRSEVFSSLGEFCTTTTDHRLSPTES